MTLNNEKLFIFVFKELSNKRNFSQINESIDSKKEFSTKLSQISSIESRKILNAKRFKTNHKKHFNQNIQKLINNQKNENKKMICVLDTNILLSHLCQLKNIIINEQNNRKLNKNNIKIDSIIIPWIVIQELDHLKNRNNGFESKFSDITNAITFINEQLKLNGISFLLKII